jgi:hypothetical protein
MKKLLMILVLFFCCALSFAAKSSNFLKVYKIGDLSIRITQIGCINLKYKGNKILAVHEVWFMNKKWRALPRKAGDVVTVEVLEESDSVVKLKIKDRRKDFLRSFEQQIKLTAKTLAVTVDYEYSKDIGQWHWPIYLVANYYEGNNYSSILADGTQKQGTISKIMPKKIIYSLDGNRNIKKLDFKLKEFDLKFTFMENGWYLCDHRGASWIKNTMMLLNSSSSKKQDVKEQYAIKITITPNNKK